MSEMKKYSTEFVIPSFQTNQFGQVTMCALIQQMLEAAWAHACEMDWGYDDLQSQHLFWVLSRMYVEVDYFPQWQDKVFLETWSSGTDGMYAYREFVLKDVRGVAFLKANSAWLILNTESHKIVRLRDQIETFPRLTVAQPCREPVRLRPGKFAQKSAIFPVGFSDLDVNRHFNSVKYLEHTFDQFGINFLNENQVKTLEINYQKEGVPGDQLFVAYNFPELELRKSTAAVIREEGNVPLVLMDINWGKRQKN